ncbi:unnamed protein product [Phytophthora fragariaefolia]|uniref:Unnamed protein product n=1 Tax=Phytophthora fragariaefolia TaxID=1490495 RepID=A0A9W6WYI3_9STRA|nr:unnamed protein product [Phytophthora fragariaefolia]
MHSVVQRKLNEWEHGAPTLRRISADDVEENLNNAVDAFRLTVGLRTVRAGHIQASAKHPKDGRPELVRETGVSIGHNCLEQVVLSKHVIKKQRISPSMVSSTAGR